VCREEKAACAVEMIDNWAKASWWA
jgi:hypothetical protein